MEMDKTMTLGSLFDGSGGFPLGGLLCGIQPVWASEVEPFPVRVTTRRFPMMEHLGDISGIDGGKIRPVDVITFGSPCQDMSVAGRRGGLDGARSGLFHEAIRIIKEMRRSGDGKHPRFIVWENVPGAYSSNGGQDFRAVLEEVASIRDDSVSVPFPRKWTGAGHIMGEGYDIAWRTFDAQYWGVPQRRRRIYLVADLDGRCAGKILFESEGLSGYPPKSFCPWKRAAGDTAAGAFKAGGTEDSVGAFLYKQGAASRSVGYEEGKSPTLSTDADHIGIICLNDQGGERMDVSEDVTCTLRAQSNHPPLVFGNHGKDARYTGPLETAQTLSAVMGTGGNNQPFVLETPKTLKMRSGKEGGGKGPLVQDDQSATLSCHNDQTLFVPAAFGICSKESHAMRSDNPKSGFYEAGTSRTLDGNGGNPACNQGGIAVVAYSASKNSYFMEAEEELANTLVATDYKDPPLVNGVDAGNGYIVRRLTPVECARLQGFPDWWCDGLETEDPSEEDIRFWTDVFEAHRNIAGTSKKPKTRNQIVKWLKDPYSDSAAYKMWGNGVALPCVSFVLAGITYFAKTDK